ncbi:hypothetical protein B7486_51555 [cyanobacterium TDX16]|nr:hypothetical protein B7486_51555 [cyanobacterium TDX16]
MTLHTPKTQPVIRAYQLQQQIERIQQHYHFTVKIESKKLLLIGCQVDNKCSMYVRRTCEIDACLLDDKPLLFNDRYSASGYAALALLRS